MKFILSLIFVVCFVVDDNIFNTDVKQVVDAVEVSLDDKSSIRLVSKCANHHDDDDNTKCVAIGGSCDCHSGCCSGYCGKDNKCTCTNKYSACVGNKECCVGTCVNITTLGNVCYCNGISEKCTKTDNATCCQGFCDSLSATCKCINETGTCKSDKECCKGKCSNGNCVCAANRDACKVTNDCCEGICRNRTCGTCSYEITSNCTNDSDCCRGKCVDDSCACGLQDDPCTYDNDCCGGTCSKPTGSPVGTCSCVSYYDVNGRQPICDPASKDSCCFGTCRLNSTNSFMCLGSLPYAECNINYDCATNVCEENRCT